ncbi:MAG TPA: glycosyltransferase family 10 [Methanolinea sp.]|nr:glycosyltransferase family 10 [Methanolinea sp.]
MTKIGFYNYYNIYNNNRMFNPEIQAPLGEDLLYPMHYLARVAKEKGISVSTIDTEPLDSYDAIFFIDFPGYGNRYFRKLLSMKFENMYLFLCENENVKPDNWRKENYRHFKKVFSWNDRLVDNKKIFKFFLANKIPTPFSFDVSEKTKFCCMIAANKWNDLPGELYSERVRAVRWFEQYHPESFDLYGKGWDFQTPSFFNPLRPYLKQIRNFFPPKYPSYRGEVASKRAILSQYKFSICYENMRDVPGYITEKIFDCFFAGCVPIYLGASNVTEYIPEYTFIDKRKFSDYPELYEFLINLSDSAYRKYLHSIEEYIQSDKISPFGAEYFVNTILNEVISSA